MDPRDLLRAFPDGMTCTVCDEPVPATRIRLLAHRDEMAFIQIECAACRSTSLGFLSGTTVSPADPISSDDVIEMHEFLAGWDGDIGALVGTTGGSGAPRERSLRPR